MRRLVFLNNTKGGVEYAYKRQLGKVSGIRLLNATKIALENESGQILQCRKIFAAEIKGRPLLSAWCLNRLSMGWTSILRYPFRVNHHGSLSIVKDRSIRERLFAEYYASLKDGVQIKRRSNDG